jgi:hypothetical protein
VAIPVIDEESDVMISLAAGLPELVPCEVEVDPSSARELAAIAADAGIRRVRFTA